MSEYEAGAVALVKRSNGEWDRAVYSASGFSAPLWRFGDGAIKSANAAEVRPLVTIDPNSAEDRERLREALFRNGYEFSRGAAVVASIRQALIEYLIPPVPPMDEPMNLFSVVMDEDGKKWVRMFDRGQTPWVPLIITDGNGRHVPPNYRGNASWDGIKNPKKSEV